MGLSDVRRVLAPLVLRPVMLGCAEVGYREQPGANVVAISYSRIVLGHEPADYLTDHNLKSTPRRTWERIAAMVEDVRPETPILASVAAPANETLAARL
jgi:hypothetical protein